MEIMKKRYLKNTECQSTAARLSMEMRQDREGREKWGDMWFVSRDGVIGKKPGHLVIPGEMEAAKVAIEHLYHPEEAALIIANLTDGAT